MIDREQFLYNLKAEKVINLDDWHLYEGFLSVFIRKDDLRHKIVFHKGRKKISQAHSSVSTRGNVILDLGSEKQTIEFE